MKNSGLVTYPGSEPDEMHLSWWGYEDHGYFIEQSTDLVTWEWVPTAMLGDEEAITLSFQSAATRMFWRLRYSNDPESDLLAADFSQTGISNWNELLLGFNPFDFEDTDLDGLPDVWKIYWLGSLDPGPNDVNPYTGLTHAQSFAEGRNPTAGAISDTNNTHVALYIHTPLD